MKRFDCLSLLTSLIDEQVITVTSLSTTTKEWTNLWKRGPIFFGLNLGMCLPFAMGLSLAFPNHRVISLDSDGSAMLDTSSLITVADVSPPNLVAIVFDNESYGTGMGPTPTARSADLEQMARGAGIGTTGTLRSLEEFAIAMKESLDGSGLRFYVAKVEPGSEPVESTYRRDDGRPMRLAFVEALRHYPDYHGE